MDAFQMGAIALRIDKLRVTKIALDIFDWLTCLNIIRNFRLDEFISMFYFFSKIIFSQSRLFSLHDLICDTLNYKLSE